MTTLAVLVASAIVGAAVGGWMARVVDGSPDTHRKALTFLLVPWYAQHAALVRSSRSGALNPLGATARDQPLLAGDVVAPLLVTVLLALVWLRPHRLRILGVALPLLAAGATWWVTLPLYVQASLRGWFFLPPELASPWMLGWHLGATVLLTTAWIWADRAMGHDAEWAD